MDLHPVLLAGGQAAGLYPLNEAYPKALLPVGNKPLLYYPLRLLEKNNFKEVTVIVNSRDLKSIKQSLDEYPRLASSDIEFNTFEVHDSDETGSAVALSALKASGRIKSDLLVLSCDVLSTVSLIQLWEKHVTLRSAVSLLLVKPLPSNNSDERQKTSTPAFGGAGEKDLIGLTESGQVVFHSSLADVDDELKLSKKMLQRTPHFKMHSNLLDSHVYIVSRWVLDYMQEHLKNALSFKREVLPHLLKNQDSKILLQFSERFHDDIDKLASQYSSSPVPSPTQCHAHTISGAELCTRVNTVSLYMEANRMIGQHSSSFMLDSGTSGQGIKSSAISGDSVVDESTQLSDKVSVKRSMIGRHCVIGEKVKVINSVIMDHVVIGESCTIQNSILCNQVRLEEKATLKDCTVGPRVTINSKAEHKGELLVEDSELDF